MEPTKKRVYFIIAGILYGIAMWFWSFFSLGAGHGTGALFVIFSSPFTFLSFFDFYLAVSLIPVIWASFGLLTAFIDYAVAKLIFLVSIVAHYMTMIYFLITLPNVWEFSFNYLNSIDGISTLVIGLVAYLLGQIVMWHRFIKGFSADIE